MLPSYDFLIQVLKKVDHVGVKVNLNVGGCQNYSPRFGSLL